MGIAECSCGRVGEYRADALTSGATTSCSCYRIGRVSTVTSKLMPPGRRYGRLVIVRRGRSIPNYAHYEFFCRQCKKLLRRSCHSSITERERSSGRIYADFAQVLIGMARPLYAHGLAGGDQQWSSLPRSRLILAHRWSNWGTNRRVNHRLD